jgi:hypothetical protein
MPPQAVAVSNSHSGPSQGSSQISSSSYMPLGYPPSFYGQYSLSRPSDGLPTLPTYSNPPYFLASVPHVQPQMHAASSSEGNNGYPTQGFYPAPVFAPVAYHHPQYVSRSDGQGPIPMHYSVYPRHSLGARREDIQHGSARNEDQDRVSSNADSDIRTI